MTTIPTPKTWAAGHWSTAEMNVHMRDVVQFFLTPPLCILRKEQGSQALANLATDPVSWDTVVYDSDGCFDSGMNTRVTAQTPGYYLFTAQVQWFHDPANTDTRSHFLYVYNSAGVLQEQHFLHCNRFQQTSESYTSSTVAPMNAGDYAILKVRIWTNATQLVGWDPTLGYYGCQMDMRWLSAL